MRNRNNYNLLMDPIKYGVVDETRVSIEINYPNTTLFVRTECFLEPKK